MASMPGLWILESLIHASDALTARFHRTPRRAPHLVLGQRGEEAAYFYLRHHGFIVVARDWRSGKARGDLDLIGWDRETLCFVEVKTRSTREVATAEAAVDEEKIQALRRLARQYLLAMPEAPTQPRFDILSVYFETQQQPSIEWIRNAFPWRPSQGYWAS